MPNEQKAIKVGKVFQRTENLPSWIKREYTLKLDADLVKALIEKCATVYAGKNGSVNQITLRVIEATSKAGEDYANVVADPFDYKDQPAFESLVAPATAATAPF